MLRLAASEHACNKKQKHGVSLIHSWSLSWGWAIRGHTFILKNEGSIHVKYNVIISQLFFCKKGNTRRCVRLLIYEKAYIQHQYTTNKLHNYSFFLNRSVIKVYYTTMVCQEPVMGQFREYLVSTCPRTLAQGSMPPKVCQYGPEAYHSRVVTLYSPHESRKSVCGTLFYMPYI